jgi:uncharacterized repeat protein (TIGR02543 family)
MTWVTYDALGGMVNAREVRKTYYLPNSYVFEPSGSSNMLVEPTRDGYILAGWYTAKTDQPTENGEEYTFSADDRWDFYLDRVQGDMTLYARWLPRGRVDYVDADTAKWSSAKTSPPTLRCRAFRSDRQLQQTETRPCSAIMRMRPARRNTTFLPMYIPSRSRLRRACMPCCMKCFRSISKRSTMWSRTRTR